MFNVIKLFFTVKFLYYQHEILSDCDPSSFFYCQIQKVVYFLEMMYT